MHLKIKKFRNYYYNTIIDGHYLLFKIKKEYKVFHIFCVNNDFN